MSQRVLIIDDEPAVRSALERTLRYFGFSVATAGAADSAYEILSHETFDAILLDIRMPLMSGDTLYLAIARRWPEMRDRIILMSGDPDSAAAGWSAELKNLPFLCKPFTQDKLREAIGAVTREVPRAEPRRSNGQA